ncbi:MAG: hypothetical protein M3O06_11440 [Pseudomonadota bacterium]|nr:hypothetical protein [Pseudomonadota bacterium]
MMSCPHRPPCPGCPRFGEAGIYPPAREALEALARSHGGRFHGGRMHYEREVPISADQTSGFRLRARLAIRGRLGSPKIGLFELGTHRVVHIPHCLVHHPLINRVASIVRRALVDARVTSYSEAAHLGTARYLQVLVERRSQTAQVVVVANSSDPQSLATCFDLIRERLGRDLHSLWFNSNCERSNVILGAEFHRVSGPPSIVEHFGGAAVHYPPGAFGQSNLQVAQSIIEHLRQAIPAGARVAEFYAGVGAIGLSLLGRTADLRMNELNAHSLQGLGLGLAELDAADRAKISVVPGPAGAAHAAAAHADVVIADPPRKGLDPELTSYLCEHPPGRFFYVSCAPESLVNDTRRLTQSGRLRLRGVTVFNMMPFTEHVETIADFEGV